MFRFFPCFSLLVATAAVFALSNQPVEKELLKASSTQSIKINKARPVPKYLDIRKIRHIVVPDAEEYKEAAEKIKVLLQQKNINVTLITDRDIEKINGNAIVIGDLTTNHIMERLYWNWYTRMLPGVLGNRGYGIQTVYKPLPILPKSDLVLIGVSNPGMLTPAVDSFKELLDQSSGNKFQPIYKLYGGAVTHFKETYFEKFSKAGGLYGFEMLIEYYMRNCDLRYFDEAMRVLYEKAKESTRDPLKFTIDWNDELNCFKAIQYWDSFACLSSLTDPQRLEIDRMFINVIDELIRRCADYSDLDENYIIPWNHTSIPLLDLYTISRYLKNRYGFDRELREFFDKTHRCFDLTVENYRPQEECIGYTLLAAEYNMYYYLMEDKKEFLESGNAQKLADLVMLHIDNNGHWAGQGDTPHAFGKAGGYNGFALLYYYLKQGEFPYVADRVKSFRFKMNTLFYNDIEPVKLDKYVGVKSVPIDKGMYELCQSYSFEHEDPVPPAIPREMTFDKLQFRSSAEPEGEYLLVDGLGRGKHQHFDTGAIVCYTAMGYKFFVDADYLCKKASDHSIINVCRDGRSDQRIPSYAGLCHSTEYDDSAFVSLIVPDYKGVDWTRNIYWEKERFFVVIDTLRAKEDAEYVLDCTWKVLDRGLEEYDGKNLTCKAPIHDYEVPRGHEKIDPIQEFPEQTFRLRSTEEGGWWDHRVSSRGLPSHRVHQTREENLKMGDCISFQNIFYIERKKESGAATDYIPHRLNEKALLLDAGKGFRLLLLDDANYKGLALRGKFVSLSTDSLMGIKISSVSQDGTSLLSADAAIDIQIKDGTLRMTSGSKGTCHIYGIEEPFVFNEGVTEYAGVKIELPLDKLPLLSKPKSGKVDKKTSLLAGKKRFKVLWKSPVTEFAYNSAADMAVGDMTGDSQNELIVASQTGDAYAYDFKGKLLWTYSNPSGLFSAAIGDIDQDGNSEVFLGTGDHSVVMLDNKGTVLKTLKVPIESSGRYGSRARDPQKVTVLSVRDINKDGRMELIVATRTWQIQIFDDQFNQLWYFTYLYHGVLDLDFTDMDNDGSEDILAADRYGTTRVLDWRSKDWATSIKAYTTTGDTSVAWTDINKDGMKQMLNASGGGMLASFARPEELKIVIKDSWDPYYGYNKLWDFNNFGYSYTDVDVLRNNSGDERVLTTSETGYIYCLDPANGKEIWSTYLGSVAHCIAIDGDEYIVAGTEKGDIFLLDSDGSILRVIRLNGRIKKIKIAGKKTAAVMDTYANTTLLTW